MLTVDVNTVLVHHETPVNGGYSPRGILLTSLDGQTDKYRHMTRHQDDTCPCLYLVSRRWPRCSLSPTPASSLTTTSLPSTTDSLLTCDSLQHQFHLRQVLVPIFHEHMTHSNIWHTHRYIYAIIWQTLLSKMLAFYTLLAEIRTPVMVMIGHMFNISYVCQT